MTDMGIQDRYDDIGNRSGLSEEIVRRVLKASRESLASSLKRGERATLPGLVTMVPEIKHRIDTESGTMVKYLKVKCTPSSAMETEMKKIQQFEPIPLSESIDLEEERSLAKLNFLEPNTTINTKPYGVRTTQISALS